KMTETKEIYGAKSTMIYVGHPKWFRPQITEFANGYGTPNIGTESSTCAYALMMACMSTFGKGVRMPQADLRRCKALCVWGVNSLYSNSVTAGGAFMNAVKRGVKLIVIDPRCTPTSEYADIHLRPVPGTDGALALGMARVIITEGLQNQEYIDKYTIGYEEYKNYVMEFTPEKVEEITGVPKEDMIAAARLMATEAPCPIQMSASPVVHNINGVQNARAIALLLALTGTFGIEGGTMPPGPGRVMLREAFLGTMHERVDADQDLSHEEFPAWAKLTSQEAQVTRIADYIEGKGDYPIRNVLSFGMNHHMWPRPDRVEEALKKLDFFVSTDIYLTDTCKFADIVLPVQTSLEREQVTVLGPDTLYYQGHVVEPMGEAWTDMDIITALAEKLGFTIGGDEPIHNNEDYLRKSISATGLTLEEIKAAPNGRKAEHIMPGRTSEQILQVKTPSGKIEFVSSIIGSCNKYGHEGLPVYHDFREKLPMDEYPLILTTGSRKPQLFHSRTYRIPWLANLEEYPLVEVHPEDAKALDMEDGEKIILKTPVGSMELTLSVNSSCLKGAVNVYHGAGNKDINLLLDDNYLDPVSGFPGFKSYCCRLEKKEVRHE
ncbi:MAG: molybdopterin-dependent oxidoreductase, partial [bacterium]|nr:molybdopterin-dependent oxidoreductase [bacterium]